MTGRSFLRLLGAALAVWSAALPAVAASILTPDDVNSIEACGGSWTATPQPCTMAALLPAPLEGAKGDEASDPCRLQLVERADTSDSELAATRIRAAETAPGDGDSVDQAASPEKRSPIPALPKAETVVLFGMGLSAAVANSMRKNWIA